MHQAHRARPTYKRATAPHPGNNAGAIPPSYTGRRHPVETGESYGNIGHLYRSNYLNYANASFTPPLRIYYTGSHIYLKDHFWRRTNSTTYSVQLVTAGSVHFEQNNAAYEVAAGEVFLLKAHASQLFRSGRTGFSHRRWVGIDGPLLEPLLHQTGLHEYDCIVPRDAAYLKKRMKRSNHVLREKNPGFIRELSILAYEIIMELCESISPSPLPPAIEGALSFIQQNARGTPSVADVAAHAGMSVSNFHALFRKHLGVSPMQLLLERKMDLTAHMLATTSLTIKEISARAGYANPLYFSSQFKKAHGVSPKKYRQLLRRRQQE